MIVGLTGGIGSGKTTVAKLFETMGCILYNSDDVAKEVYYLAHVKPQIIALLGEQSYLDASTIDKAYISKKVFSNTELLQKLNEIIHPAVKTDFIEFQKKHPASIVIKESALLFETGIYKELDKTILVIAPTTIKIERIKKRNASSEDEIKKRIASQWSDEQKKPLADFVISNDGSEALIPQALAIIKQLK